MLDEFSNSVVNHSPLVCLQTFFTDLFQQPLARLKALFPHRMANHLVPLDDCLLLSS